MGSKVTKNIEHQIDTAQDNNTKSMNKNINADAESPSSFLIPLAKLLKN
jgi:hypothetical protein